MRSKRTWLVMLLILFAQLTFGARRLSFTSDEPSHIASGYAYLARGATWTVPLRGHPPLINAWSALPIYLGDPAIPLETLDGWGEDNTRYVKAFAPYLAAQVTRAEVASRTPVMLLTVLLAAVTARWAADLWGRNGGLLALMVLTFDPTLLAHGMLATNDVGVIALGTAGLFVIWRLLHRPNARRAIAAGLLLGATLLAKGSGVLWFGAAGLMLIVHALRRGHDARTLRRWGRYGLVMAGLAGLCVWAFYGFEIQMQEGIPLPAATHIAAITAQSSGAEARWTYFLGRIEQGGRWSYFPVAFLIKNPLPLLVLVIWGVAACVARREKVLAVELWLFPAIYTAAALYTGVNIGYRHMLPVHPFLYLLIAGLPLRRRLARAAILGLTAWLGVAALWIAPDYIAYFNPLVGGPEQGWRYLADSNTDWGQGYKALRAFQITHDLPTFGYSGPEGYIRLAPYGVTFTPLPPMHSNPEPLLKPWLEPAPGDYIISADTLSGLGSVDPDNYAWFRYHAPDAVIARVLYYYHITAPAQPPWLVQCSVPTPPLDDATIAVGFAHPPARQMALDCTQAWLYPDGGSTPGAYALHAQALSPAPPLARLNLTPPRPSDPFIARRVRGLTLSYRQWDYRTLPAFVLYTNAPNLTWPTPQRMYAGPAGEPSLTAETRCDAPQAFDGPLTFLGATAFTAEDALEVETWWRVTQGPLERPLSLMAHLLDGEQQMLAVADGLGVPPQQWQPGDVLVQRHRFPPSEGQVWLRTGVYWQDTGERLPLAERPGDALFIALTPQETKH